MLVILSYYVVLRYIWCFFFTTTKEVFWIENDIYTNSTSVNECYDTAVLWIHMFYHTLDFKFGLYICVKFKIQSTYQRRIVNTPSKVVYFECHSCGIIIKLSYLHCYIYHNKK